MRNIERPETLMTTQFRSSMLFSEFYNERLSEIKSILPIPTRLFGLHVYQNFQNFLSNTLIRTTRLLDFSNFSIQHVYQDYTVIRNTRVGELKFATISYKQRFSKKIGKKFEATLVTHAKRVELAVNKTQHPKGSSQF